MKYLIVMVAIAAGLWSANAQTAAEIIEMNLKARGGKEKILSLRNMSMECVSSRQGMEFPVKLTFSHNQGFRTDMQIMGMDCFMLVNTKSAYSYFPMRGQSKPEEMPAEMHKSMLSRLDLHGDFIDYEAKGVTYSLLPEDSVDEKHCYVILSKNKEGKEKTIFIDKESKLITKEIVKAEVEGEEREFASVYSNYKSIDGFLLPTFISSPMNGDMTVTKYVVNAELKPDIFEIKK